MAEKRGRAALIILRDALILGAALVVFAFFHHAMPQKGEAIQSIITPAPVAPLAAIVPKATPSATERPRETAAPVYPAGDFSAAFPKKDTGEGALHSFQSDNARIRIDMVQENNITYFVADVWVRSINYFRTAFAKGQFGSGISDTVPNMAKENGAALAVNGDFYGARKSGLVIRNGELYREKGKGTSGVSTQICVIYYSGEMEVIEKDKLDMEALIARGAWQAWSFGPSLLEGGKAIAKIESQIGRDNPRCAIGYYEPGHYCLVLVDGRRDGWSEGMSLEELSALFESLGCKEAYNLDGGATAVMTFGEEKVNKPYKGGRKSSDIVYIGGWE